MTKFGYGLLGFILGALFDAAMTLFAISAGLQGGGLGVIIGILAYLFAPYGMAAGAAIGVAVALRLLKNINAKMATGASRRDVNWYFAKCLIGSLCVIVGLVWGALQFVGPPPEPS